MKLKITVDGALYLQRKNQMQLAECPIYPGRYCGDWCAHFEEPITNDSTIILSLCHDKVYVVDKDDLIDERP